MEGKSGGGREEQEVGEEDVDSENHGAPSEGLESMCLVCPHPDLASPKALGVPLFKKCV